ncbi:VOC family protein [Nocardioides sp. SYSU DS0663]|uniref:VOC family protein n=1 Tax=Nocardioides sp. SYSU DS0663 TaxID=3416445 RepID=UPI003F4C8256
MKTLENIVYTVSDLDAAKAIHIALLGAEPHTDQPFYVGFRVEGVEIGLTPVQPGGSTQTVAHIRVPDLETALDEVQKAGATVVGDPRDVGGGTRVATVRDPGGIPYGLIEHAGRGA